jgi:hypothetical protein
MFSFSGKTALMREAEFIGVSFARNSSTITLPSGLQPNDVVIIASSNDYASGPSVPTGYTQGQRGAAADVGYMWSYKVMPDPVDTTATGLTSSSYVAHIAIAFRYINTSNILDVTTPPIATNGGMPNPPEITTSNKSIIVCIGFIEDICILNPTPPTGYILAGATSAPIRTDGQEADSTSSIMAAYQLSNAGTYNPALFTGYATGQPSVAATFALRSE